MYKKEIFRNLDKKYNSHLYTDLQGFFMKYGHKVLEFAIIYLNLEIRNYKIFFTIDITKKEKLNKIKTTNFFLVKFFKKFE